MEGKSESEVAQSCPTLRDPMVCSLPGSSLHGVFQARVLEWGAIAFSTGGASGKKKKKKKNPPANAGDISDESSILGSGRSPGGGHSNPPQYSCLENPMDRGGWWATVGVAKSGHD